MSSPDTSQSGIGTSSSGGGGGAGYRGGSPGGMFQYDFLTASALCHAGGGGGGGSSWIANSGSTLFGTAAQDAGRVLVSFAQPGS